MKNYPKGVHRNRKEHDDYTVAYDSRQQDNIRSIHHTSVVQPRLEMGSAPLHMHGKHMDKGGTDGLENVYRAKSVKEGGKTPKRAPRHA